MGGGHELRLGQEDLSGDIVAGGDGGRARPQYLLRVVGAHVYDARSRGGRHLLLLQSAVMRRMVLATWLAVDAAAAATAVRLLGHCVGQLVRVVVEGAEWHGQFGHLMERKAR